jgi:hypothetical protein
MWNRWCTRESYAETYQNYKAALMKLRQLLHVSKVIIFKLGKVEYAEKLVPLTKLCTTYRNYTVALMNKKQPLSSKVIISKIGRIEYAEQLVY